MMKIRAFIVCMMVILIAVPASAQFDKIFKGLGIGQTAGLSDEKIGSGLKEALKVGTENAVGLTGREGTDTFLIRPSRS